MKKLSFTASLLCSAAFVSLLISQPVKADEMSDLKAQMKVLNERLNQLEKAPAPAASSMASMLWIKSIIA
jgi:hypothetical protein